MKLVVAIIRPDRVNAVLEELYKADVQGVSISRVQGHGGEREQVETYRGTTVKMALEDEGWEVSEAETGEQALEAFARQPSDVVLVGITLGMLSYF